MFIPFVKRCSLYLASSAALCSVGHAQCGTGLQSLYGSSMVIRSGATVVTSTQITAGGTDLPYLLFQVVQHNTLTNGASTITFPDVTSTAVAGNEAYTERDFNANDYGNQTYNLSDNLYLVDSCTGQKYPPFQEGYLDGVIPTKSLLVNMPVLAAAWGKIYNQGIIFVTTGDGSSGPSRNPVRGSNPTKVDGHGPYDYWTVTPGVGMVMPVSPGPQLNFVVQAAGVTQSLAQPNIFQVTAATTTPHSCTTGASGYVLWDGLKSNVVMDNILLQRNVDFTNPTTMSHVDHSQVTDPNGNIGYNSAWYYQNVDDCGYVGNAQNHETFGPAAQVYPNPQAPKSNWAIAAASTWVGSSGGTWTDNIGFTAQPGNIPLSTGPQNPLNPQQVTTAPQSYFIDPILTWSGIQVHFIDHGGYAGPNP